MSEVEDELLGLGESGKFINGAEDGKGATIHSREVADVGEGTTEEAEEQEGPSAQASETRELSPETEEDIEQTEQDRSYDLGLSPTSDASVSHQPAPLSVAPEIQPTLRSSNPRQIFHWPRRMRCGFWFESRGRKSKPLGNPVEAMNGWAVYLDVDAGRHGRPTISLYFSFNNGKKDVPVSRKRDQRTDFAITWRTGVGNDQHPMIAKFKAHILSEIFKIEKQREPIKLVEIKFESNSIEKPPFSATDKKPWKGLPTDVQQCLETFFFTDEPLSMTIRFCIDSNPEIASMNWGSALQRAVEQI